MGSKGKEGPMHRVWSKLKGLKADLKELNTYMASYKLQLNKARHRLEVIQSELKNQHMDQRLIDQEKMALMEVEKWSSIEE